MKTSNATVFAKKRLKIEAGSFANLSATDPDDDGCVKVYKPKVATSQENEEGAINRLPPWGKWHLV